MSKSLLLELMSEDIPGISFQKKQGYRTSVKEVVSIFKILNKEIFGNKLPTPQIKLLNRTKDYWGLCEARHFLPISKKRSNCTISVSNKWYCKQWLVMTLAHEMCHQYQWDIQSIKRLKQGKGPLMSHGPSFFVFRDKLAKYGIPLKRANSIKSWFVHQNLFKC